jgi:hypothetical protein
MTRSRFEIEFDEAGKTKEKINSVTGLFDRRRNRKQRRLLKS